MRYFFLYHHFHPEHLMTELASALYYPSQHCTETDGEARPIGISCVSLIWPGLADCDVLLSSSCWVSPRRSTRRRSRTIQSVHKTKRHDGRSLLLPSFLRLGGPRKSRRYGFIFRLVLYFSGCSSLFSSSRVSAWLYTINENHLSVRPSVSDDDCVAVAAAAATDDDDDDAASQHDFFLFVWFKLAAR